MRIEHTYTPKAEAFHQAATPVPSTTIRAVAEAGHALFSNSTAANKPLLNSRFNSHLSTLAKVGLVAIAVATLVPTVSAFCDEVCGSPRWDCEYPLVTECNWYGCWDYVAKHCDWVQVCRLVCY